MKYPKTFFFIGIAALSMVGCSDTSDSGESGIHGTDTDSITEVAEFEVLDTWDVAGEEGVALLVEESIDESGYAAVVRNYVEDNDPAVLQIFSTQQAFEATHNDQHDEDYRMGFILMYMKSLGEHGEIMWMQEEGNVSHLNGRVTPLARGD